MYLSSAVHINSFQNNLGTPHEVPYRRIKWDPRYSVHNEAIDAQHWEFFSIVNRIMEIHENGSNEIYPVFRDLVDLKSIHFHSEHMIMMESNYPDFHRHCLKHDQFIMETQGFLESCKKDSGKLSRNMLPYLYDWVFSHILNSDLKYGNWYESMSQRKFPEPLQRLRKNRRALQHDPMDLPY